MLSILKVAVGIDDLLDIFGIFTQKFLLNKILCKYFLQCTKLKFTFFSFSLFNKSLKSKMCEKFLDSKFKKKIVT